MNRRFSLRFAVGLSLLFGVSFGLRAETLLRLRLAEGQKFRYRCQVNMETAMTLPLPDNPQELNQTSKQTMDMEERVLKVDEEGIATVEAKITRVSAETDLGPLGSFAYDSENPENDSDSPLASGYEKFLNKPYTMKINPRGKVLEITGLSEILKDATPPDNPMFGQMGASFGDDELRDMFRNLSPIYPEEPQSSWTQEEETTIPMFGKVKARTEYSTLGEKVIREIPSVELEMASTMETDEDAKKISEGAIEMLVKMDAMTMKGKMAVAAEDGMVVDSKMDMTMRLAMTVSSQGGEAASAVPPMMMTANSKTTILIQRLKWETDEE